jgi:hypothetical protein
MYKIKAEAMKNKSYQLFINFDQISKPMIPPDYEHHDFGFMIDG